MDAATKPTLVLLEDNAIVALDLENLIGDTGLVEVVWAATLKEAREVCGQNDGAPALLDVNINGENSFGLAQELVAQGRRIAFLTGYTDLGDLPSALGAVPVLGKPVDPAELKAVLGRLLVKV